MFHAQKVTQTQMENVIEHDMQMDKMAEMALQYI